MRCSIIESLLESSLQCLYRDSCLNVLVYYLNYTSIYAQYVSTLNKTSLVGFAEDSTINAIADKSFVNEWIQTISHAKFFETCAPKTCSFTYVRRLNLLYVITTLVAVIGGLSFFLRFLSPLLIKLTAQCCRRNINSLETNASGLHHSTTDSASIPLKNDRCAFCTSLPKLLQTKLISLTLFRTSYFASVDDRTVGESLNRIATRLYLLALTLSLGILCINALVESRTVIKTITNPSVWIAQQILTEHSDSAECPCKKISVPMNQLVSIQPRFHQARHMTGMTATCIAYSIC